MISVFCSISLNRRICHFLVCIGLVIHTVSIIRSLGFLGAVGLLWGRRKCRRGWRDSPRYPISSRFLGHLPTVYIFYFIFLLFLCFIFQFFVFVFYLSRWVSYRVSPFSEPPSSSSCAASSFPLFPTSSGHPTHLHLVSSFVSELLQFYTYFVRQLHRLFQISELPFCHSLLIVSHHYPLLIVAVILIIILLNIHIIVIHTILLTIEFLLHHTILNLFLNLLQILHIIIIIFIINWWLRGCSSWTTMLLLFWLLASPFWFWFNKIMIKSYDGVLGSQAESLDLWCLSMRDASSAGELHLALQHEVNVEHYFWHLYENYLES